MKGTLPLFLFFLQFSFLFGQSVDKKILFNKNYSDTPLSVVLDNIQNINVKFRINSDALDT